MDASAGEARRTNRQVCEFLVCTSPPEQQSVPLAGPVFHLFAVFLFSSCISVKSLSQLAPSHCLHTWCSNLLFLAQSASLSTVVKLVMLSLLQLITNLNCLQHSNTCIQGRYPVVWPGISIFEHFGCFYKCIWSS